MVTLAVVVASQIAGVGHQVAGLLLLLALPAKFDLAPLVGVTQTLVELVVMVVFVRLIPRLLPERSGRITAA